MAMAFANARVLTSEGFWDDVAVLVDNGAVTAIVDADDARLRDADVRDLILASFVENIEQDDPAYRALRAALGPALRTALHEQESWSPRHLEPPT